MADILTPAARSRMMSNIRGKNTRPELIVRKFLHRSGLRFRIHAKNLPGAPDIVLPKYRAVVLVHGCFWHQHPGCKYAYKPKTNQVFWSEKLSANRVRDDQNEAELMARGWTVFTVWECSLHGLGVLTALVEAIRDLEPARANRDRGASS